MFRTIAAEVIAYNPAARVFDTVTPSLDAVVLVNVDALLDVMK
jgi:hypothetical protein